MSYSLFDCQELHAYGFRGDNMGLLLILADLWEKDHSLFGDTERVQNETKTALVSIIQNSMRNASGNADSRATANAIVTLFRNNNINPLNDISIINVSPTKPHAALWEPLIDLCKSYKAIAVPISGTEGKLCTSKNAAELCGGEKADYVITGNVVGYIRSPEGLDDFMKASAMMTKKSGRTIHLLDLGTTPEYVKHLQQENTYNNIGQKFLHLIPHRRSYESPIASVTVQDRELGFDGKIVVNDSGCAIDTATAQLEGRQHTSGHHDLPGHT